MRFATTHSSDQEGTRMVKAKATVRTVEVVADGDGLWSSPMKQGIENTSDCYFEQESF